MAGGVYVRSFRGLGGAWYRRALDRPTGTVRAGGREVAVTFSPVDVDDASLQAAISAAYRSKYARSGASYVAPMVSDQSEDTTLRLDARA